jgi:fructokinase
MPTYAAVEGGGTTWRVAIAEGHPSNIVESEVYETIDDPVEQLRIIREWLDKRKFDALGIATFGPIDPRPGSSTYGYITTTPKPGWANVDVVGALSDGQVPVQFDTDVNAPALAEYMVSTLRQ